MAEEVVKLPISRLEVPRPKPWDLAAGLTLLASLGAAGGNLVMALAQPAGQSIAGSTTTLFVLAQLALTVVALLVLGKTAKLGTIWGNLMAVAGLFAGMSGVLLAAALWSAA